MPSRCVAAGRHACGTITPMTNRCVTGSWAIVRFSGKGIYAKARSRKDAKAQKKRKKDEHDRERHPLRCRVPSSPNCASRQRIAGRPTMTTSCLSFAPSRLGALAQKLKPFFAARQSTRGHKDRQMNECRLSLRERGVLRGAKGNTCFRAQPDLPLPSSLGRVPSRPGRVYEHLIGATTEQLQR